MDSSGPHSFTNSIQDMQNDKRRKKEKICIKICKTTQTHKDFLIITYCSSLLKNAEKGKGHKKSFTKDYLMDEDIKVQFHLL